MSTIAEVHDHLWRSSHVGFVELAGFMTELCKKLRAEGFDIEQPRASLGFKVVTGMVPAASGPLTIANDRKGTSFLLDLPILYKPDES